MPSEPSAPFGDLLRRHRQAAGLTQEELAERAGLSRRGIADLERGARQTPRKDTVALLVAALGLAGEDYTDFVVAAHPPAGSSPDLPADFPPLNALDRHAHNLPIQPTPLLGRAREVREVGALLRREEVRLVTLTGPGGVGKTRLALQVAAELSDQFTDGVWFVPLSRLADPALVLPTIAHTLGLQEAGNQPVVTVLRAWLRTRAVLLLLDNFEQVVAVAPAVADLLARSPGLRVLVTSRVALRLRGEQEYPLLPLALPPIAWPVPSSRTPPDSPKPLTEYAAVALFLQRAQGARPDFQLNEASAQVVVAICARLDGLPLALELAAVRVKLLAPAALLRRLEQTLPLLTGGARDLEARQQTMRATLAWSEDLLQPEERRLFQRLAVFVGGFTLEAAEAICAAPQGAERLGVDVVEGLAALVDHSLAQRWSAGQDEAEEAEEGGGEARFRLLYVVREYALERLEASGEAEALCRAHAMYYLGLAEGRMYAVYGPEGADWMRRLEREQDNFRAALGWMRERGEAELGLRLAGSLAPFWDLRGYRTEGRGWLEELLALAPRVAGDGSAGAPGMVGVSAATQAKALLGAGIFAQAGDDEQALAAAKEALALARGQKARWGAWAAGVALHLLGNIAWDRGELEQALACCEESVAQLRAAGEEGIAAANLTQVGGIALDQGDLERAAACCEESLAFARRSGADFVAGFALRVLADVARRRGDLARADVLGREQLLVWRRLGAPGYLAGSLEGLARTAAAAGEEAPAERAARLLGAAAALRERVGAPRRPHGRADTERAAAPARAALGEAAWVAAFASGRALTLEEAIAEALGDDESAEA
jgi:non-specific serine/threonine protein kinase